MSKRIEGGVMKTITIKNATGIKIEEEARSMKKELIVQGPEEMDVSDGYHTFKELYEQSFAKILRDGIPYLETYFNNDYSPLYFSHKIQIQIENELNSFKFHCSLIGKKEFITSVVKISIKEADLKGYFKYSHDIIQDMKSSLEKSIRNRGIESLNK